MAANQALESQYNRDFIMQLRAPANGQKAATEHYIVEELNHVLYLSLSDLLSGSPVNSDALFDVKLQNSVNGDAYWDGKQVIFIPDSGYTGRASFEYTLMDTLGQTDSATVTIKI